MKTAAILAVATALAAGCSNIKTQTLEYRQGGTVCEGYLAYDSNLKGKRPGVVVVHEWMGLNDYAKQRARQLAELGYIALAADIYGKGVRASNPQEARELATKYRADRSLMRARAEAALTTLKAQSRCDPDRTAAMGYCFGGGVALELARSGADMRGVVSFHGNLDTPNPEDNRNIKCKVLVCHGAADTAVPLSQVVEFIESLEKTNVDYEVDVYGHAVHAFTNPANGERYNEPADRRSWERMKAFFEEIFE